MNVIHSIGLQGVGPFKQVQFKIPKGISVIYGLNRAQGKSARNPNAVGKSLLTSIIPEILYEEPIVGEKADRVRKGSRALSFTSHTGKRVLVKRTARGQTDKVTVSVDGKDQEALTSTKAKAFFAKEWPITSADYRTYVHIDSRVPHPLVMGDTTERKKFFTEFFNLKQVDTERKLYLAELGKLGKVRAAFNELRSQYLRTKRDLLTPEQLTEYQTRKKKLSSTLRSLQDEFASVQEVIRLVSFAESAAAEIREVLRAIPNFDEEGFAEAVKANKWELEKTAKDLEDARAYNDYLKDSAKYTEAYNKLPRIAVQAIEKYGRKVARKKAGTNTDLRMHASVDVNNAENWIKKLEDRLAEPEVKRVSAPAEDEEELRTLKRVYEHHLEHAEKFEDGKCETCGQPVKIKDPAVVRKKLKIIKGKLQQCADASAYCMDVAERGAAKGKLETWRAKLIEYQATEARYSKWERVGEALDKLPEEPEPFTGKKLQAAVLEKALEELRERRSLLKYLQPHVQTIISFLALTDEQKKQAREFENQNDKMHSIQQKLTTINAKLEVQNQSEKRCTEMRDRLRTMKTQLHDEEPLKHLVNGYQDKNIKKMQVEAISQRLFVLINKYARLVMPERTEFEFVWDSQISILAHRYVRDTVDTTDVRKLSGAESTLFTLILVCALLNFVPSHKRCSILILDEPSARMGPDNIETMQKMLKILNSLIPSIIIITPKGELYEGAKNYTIIKSSNGESRIVEGLPEQVRAMD